MNKVYEYKNATIYVTSTKTFSREELVKSTEDFMKKAICGGKNNGNVNKTGDFSKE